MNLKDSSISKPILDFYFNELDPNIFSSKLHDAADEIERLIGDNLYFDLIDCDLSTKEGIERIKIKITQFYSDDKNTLFKDRAIDICEKIISTKLTITDGCRILSDLELSGADFIPPVFDGYSSEFDDGMDVEFYKDRVIADTKTLLGNLKS